MKFSFQVSYHEAGHAFAYWHLGFPLHAVQVISDRAFARKHWLVSKDGKQLTECPGICELESSFFDVRRLHASNGAARTKELCAMQIFASSAGPINTALLVNWPLPHVFASSGAADLDKIEMCCAVGNIGKNHKEKLIARSIAILHSAPARQAMLVISNHLSRHGRLGGDRIASICNGVRGARREAFRFSN